MVRKVFSSRNLIAAAGTVVTVAISVIVNIWTERWSWVAVAFLVGRIATAVALSVMTSQQTGAARTTVAQSATAGGRITDVHVRAGTGAEVDEVATNDGVIQRSAITANNATVRQSTDGGLIEDSDVTAD